MNVLKTTNLTKRYGKRTVVDRVSMTVARGDIYGFVGRNGAGKTTFMRTVLGMALPSAGSCEFFDGMEPGQARRRIGALIEAPNLFRNCTALENMKRFSMLYGGHEGQETELLDFVGLADVGKKKVGSFSLGMRQRLGIAAALIGDPEFLILDEPVNGLDPAGIVEVRDLIIRLNQERKITFLISSHLLDELSKIATVYGIIDNGVLIEEIRANELESRFGSSLRIVADDVQKAAAILATKIPENEIQVRGEEIFIKSAQQESGKINCLLVENGVEVSELNRITESIEHYFMERVGR